MKSPVVVVPASLSSQDCLVAHLGEITVSNSYTRVDDEMCCDHAHRGTTLSSQSVDRLLLTISNMSLHSSHDQASRDWLLSNVEDEQPCVSGRWSKVIREASFELQIDRALRGDDRVDLGSGGEEEEVDVLISCRVPNALIVLLPKEVFDQLKKTMTHGLYWPLQQSSPSSAQAPVHSSSGASTKAPNDPLPRMCASFSLPKLTLSVRHNVGHSEKDVVTVSLEEFYAQCRKTSADLTHVDLSLKTILIEDMLQAPDSNYRYILSSSLKPLHFPSPLPTPSHALSSSSLSSLRLGMTTSVSHQFLRLTQLTSSPKPPPSSFSPLRSFNPYPWATKATTESHDSPMTTPSREHSFSSLTDIQDLVSVHAVLVSGDDPELVTKYNSVSQGTVKYDMLYFSQSQEAACIYLFVYVYLLWWHILRLYFKSIY